MSIIKYTITAYVLLTSLVCVAKIIFEVLGGINENFARYSCCFGSSSVLCELGGICRKKGEGLNVK